MGDLRGLIERLEKLEGPSREVDAEIDAALFGGRASHAFTEDNGGARLRRSYDVGTVFLHHDPMHNGGNVLISHYRKSSEVTGSLDAAIALCERVLPGWTWNIGGCPPDFLTDKDKPFGAELMGPVSWAVIDREMGEEPVYDTASAQHLSPAIALVLATLRALEAQGG